MLCLRFSLSSLNINNMEVKEILQKFGFSEKEIAVYIALVEFGPAVASDVAERAKLNRSTTYVVLDSLVKRGVVDPADRPGGDLFTALAPDKLAQHLAAIAAEYTDVAKIAREELARLKQAPAMAAPSLSPTVRFFEGDEGIQDVYEDALASLETIRSYASATATDNSAARQYQELLSKKHCKVRMLPLDDTEAKRLAGREGVSGETGVLYGLSPEISIYDNKIVFVSPTEKTALVIESKEFAQALKQAFDRSWAKEQHGRGRAAFGEA